MSRREEYKGGILRKQWDSITGYKEWDAAGQLTLQRALNTEEAAQAAIDDAAQAAEAVVSTRKASIRATAATLATLRGQAVTLSTATNGAMTQAEKRALGSGLVDLIDVIAKIGKEALKED